MAQGGGVCNLVSQGFLDQVSHADLCIQNGGGCKTDILAGNFTTVDANVLLPFNNTLVVLNLTGAQIIQVLNEAVDYAFAPDGGTGSYPYGAGLRFDVDANAAFPNYVTNVEVNIRLGSVWEAIDPAQTYAVTTNNFIAAGEDGYLTFGGVSVEDTELPYAQSFIAYADELGVLVDPPLYEYSTKRFVPLVKPPTTAPVSAPTAAPTQSSSWCFSSKASIQVQGKGTVRMDQLMVGDSVLSSDGAYTQVYSFGHWDPSAETEYLQIYSSAAKQPLEITADHMLYLYLDTDKKETLVPARDVKVGDRLLTQEGLAPVLVASVRKVSRRGAYAPFTTSGSLSVNGIAVSNYVALPSTLFRSSDTYEQQHWLQHAAYLPYRVYCGISGCEGEHYDEKSGLSQAVMFWIPLLHWLERHRVVFQPIFHFFGSVTHARGLSLHLLVLTVSAVACFGRLLKSKATGKKV